MQVSRIRAYDRDFVLACDAKCDKAWGISSRPKIEFDENDPDDIAFRGDEDLGTAPKYPGTWEGGEGKPLEPVHNKWCFRECERSESCPIENFPSLVFKDWSKRIYNQPWKHKVKP